MQYPAHIRADMDGNPADIQTVEAHSLAVSALAQRKLAAVGLGKTGALLGRMHDLGKFTADFKEYIECAARGEEVTRGSVNHTFAAVRLLWEQFRGRQGPMGDVVCELLSAAMGSHHGLFDCIGAQGEDGFAHRVQTELPHYAEARRAFFERCMDQAQLSDAFSQVVEELTAFMEQISDIAASDDEVRFYEAMLCRLLTSALIDADRRDTAAFMNGVSPPLPPADPWTAALGRVERRLADMKGTGAVNDARRAISDTCRAAARLPGGIHRLSVPTGSGKTLSALRYALAKAKETGRQRIFFVIPLLSVLEQNAAVIRDFLGDDSLILEHHSNLVREKTDGAQLDPHELLMESWDAPVVITTLVQLLNTLFAGKTSCIRRMQALTNSIIVIDEVQSVPGKLLSLFNMAMNFLAACCGAEIVLCSATQPCLEQAAHGILYARPAELIPLSEQLWSPFRRTRLIDRRRAGGYTPEQLSMFASQVLEETDSLLIICNLKSQAKALYALLKDSGAAVFHLSTDMCMAHRQATLQAVNQALLRARAVGGKKVLCVSTQLVEAGVDFSFGSVIRLLAGMDNAVQSAGRCNRNGEREAPCSVYLVEMQQEKLGPLKEIERAQNATKNLLEQFARDGAPFQNDLASRQAIDAYYRGLFGQMKTTGAQDFPLPKLATSIYDLLSDNEQFAAHGEDADTHELRQAFKTAGEQFQVFEEGTTDLLVPYSAGEEYIAELSSQRAGYDGAFCAAVLKKAKPFTVSLYENQLRRLRERGGLSTALGGTILVLNDGFYSAETGVVPDGIQLFREV